MSRSPNLTAITWLIRDTFRQSISTGIFAVLLTISVVSIAVCLSLGVDGRATMAQGDENPDFLSRKDAESKEADKLSTSGVIVAEGSLTLAFGAIDVPLARDTRGAVHFFELLLAGGVADTLGLLLTLIWTAGFLPGFLEGRNICILLAKPASRWVLLLGKYIGVLCFVLVNAIIFVGGTWLAIGMRTGIWDATYLLSIPLLLLHFSIFFGVSVLLAVWTQNAVVCVFGSIVFWCVAWSVNFGHHALVTANDMLSESMRSSVLGHALDFSYWFLPKPADLGLLLYNALGAEGHFSQVFDPTVLEAQGFSMVLAVLSSIAFAAFVLWISIRKFATTDY